MFVCFWPGHKPRILDSLVAAVVTSPIYTTTSYSREKTASLLPPPTPPSKTEGLIHPSTHHPATDQQRVPEGPLPPLLTSVPIYSGGRDWPSTAGKLISTSRWCRLGRPKPTV